MNEYKIAGVRCAIKDLTLDEADEVNAIFTMHGVNELEVDNMNSKRFLEIVLAPVNKGEKIDAGKCTEETALCIFKDFFLKRIESRSELRKSFGALAKKLKP